MLKRVLGKAVKVFFIAGFTLLLFGTAYEEYSRRSSHRAFPPPGEMIDVGGHALHLNCVGEGRPTVLLEAGLDPSGSLSWSRVQPMLAEFTRVCSYDRAGMVWSESGPRPRDGNQVVGELETLLASAGEAGPFVLAGHSHGGLYARIFAERNPTVVAGLVLVDATHPETMQRLPPDLQDPPNMSGLTQSVLVGVARTGAFRVLGSGGTREAYPDSVLPVLARFGVQSMAALFAEADATPATDSIARQTGPFQGLPLLVLTPEVPVPPGSYGLTEDQTTRLNALLSELQGELATLSSVGRIERVPGVGHYVQLDDPDATARGIRSVVEEAREREADDAQARPGASSAGKTLVSRPGAPHDMHPTLGCARRPSIGGQMPRIRMNDEEVARRLEDCQLVRVAFHDATAIYLIPLGCVWNDGALYGVADPGRKTELAKKNPRVAFQTDTAKETGFFEWESVTGQGDFEVVSDPREISGAMAKLQPFVETAPDWWKEEQGPKIASGQLLVWRIRPRVTTGMRYSRPEKA